MYFKIDYDKLSEIGKSFDNKSEELESLYDDVLDICDSIEANYKSFDSDIYIERFRNYIKLFKIENEDLKNGGLVLKRISSLYENQDKAWENKVNQFDRDKRRT